MSEPYVQMVRDAIAGFNDGDPDRMAASMAPGGVIVPLRAALEDIVYEGPNAAHEFWAASMQAWSALHIDVSEFRDLGDRVLVLGRLIATARETGVELDTQVAWIVTFEDDQVAEIRTFASQAEALAAAGLRE
jgi:ketosteroid isomerase-like protein